MARLYICLRGLNTTHGSAKGRVSSSHGASRLGFSPRLAQSWREWLFADSKAQFEAAVVYRFYVAFASLGCIMCDSSSRRDFVPAPTLISYHTRPVCGVAATKSCKGYWKGLYQIGNILPVSYYEYDTNQVGLQERTTADISPATARGPPAYCWTL